MASWIDRRASTRAPPEPRPCAHARGSVEARSRAQSDRAAPAPATPVNDGRYLATSVDPDAASCPKAGDPGMAEAKVRQDASRPPMRATGTPWRDSSAFLGHDRRQAGDRPRSEDNRGDCRISSDHRAAPASNPRHWQARYQARAKAKDSGCWAQEPILLTGCVKPQAQQQP